MHVLYPMQLLCLMMLLVLWLVLVLHTNAQCIGILTFTDFHQFIYYYMTMHVICCYGAIQSTPQGLGMEWLVCLIR